MQADEDLISKYYDCDDAAFKELKRRYDQKLYAFFRTRGVADRDIPDCVKETWFRIIKTKETGKNRYDPKRGSFKVWLYRIANNVAVNLRRRRRNEVLESDLKKDDAGEASPLDGLDTGLDPIETLLKEEEARHVRECLETLTALERAVIRLNVVEEMTLREIGMVFGISIPTVWRIRERAKEKLRDCVQRKAGTKTGS